MDGVARCLPTAFPTSAAACTHLTRDISTRCTEDDKSVSYPIYHVHHDRRLSRYENESQPHTPEYIYANSPRAHVRVLRMYRRARPLTVLGLLLGDRCAEVGTHPGRLEQEQREQ